MEWAQPKVIPDVDHAFPANVIGRFLPLREDIPEEFFNDHNGWTKLASQWFFNGINIERFIPKENIDIKIALRHLGTCLRSFQPQHEHKEAGVGYLMSLWFEEATIKDPSSSG